jgi:hypothetical protein
LLDFCGENYLALFSVIYFCQIIGDIQFADPHRYRATRIQKVSNKSAARNIREHIEISKPITIISSKR